MASITQPIDLGPFEDASSCRVLSCNGLACSAAARVWQKRQPERAYGVIHWPGDYRNTNPLGSTEYLSWISAETRQTDVSS